MPLEGQGGDLDIAITTHHDLETATPASVVRWLHQAGEAEVRIKGNDIRTATVKVATDYEPVSILDGGRNDYLYRLFIRYQGKPAIWAPLVSKWSRKSHSVELSCIDADRMQNHFVRDGDEAIDPDSAYIGQLPVDYRGLRILRDAANNTPEQDARFVVPLGIRDGTNTHTASTRRIKVSRGDQVFSAQAQLSGAEGAPDFELEVLDVEDAGAYPDYMQLNTFDRQGEDRTSGVDAVVLHCGFGLDNLSDFQSTPGKFVTHAHVLGEGGRPRVTRYHADASRERGVYVLWLATQFKASEDDAESMAALEAVAEAIIKAYGLPLHAYTLELKPDALQHWVAHRGYGIGDTVRAAVKDGYWQDQIEARVTELVLKRLDRTSATIADITVIPSLVDDEDIAGDEE